jgi:hypothetical protein
MVSFESSVVDAIAAGDAGAARIRAMIDTMISVRGLDAPQRSSIPTRSWRRRFPNRPRSSIAAGPASSPWCGARASSAISRTCPPSCWLPTARRCTAAPHLPPRGCGFAVGKWLVRRDSGIMLGMAKDAALVGNAVREHLDF